MFGIVLFAFMALWSTPIKADGTGINLLKNSSFEEYEDQSAGLFGNYTDFDEWYRSGGFCTLSETSDVYDGGAAMKLGGSTAATVYQQVTDLTDAYYDADAPFRLTIHYKALTVKNGGQISLEAYWEHATVVDELKGHDAAVLQRVLSDTAQSEWQSLVIETTRPQNAKSFMLQFKATANSYVLVDSLSFEALPRTTEEPFITAQPKTLGSVRCELGQSVDFQTIHITHGNVEGATTFELSYTDADQFRLSRTTLGADESECDLIITYAPTRAGTHRAVLNIDNWSHTTLFQSITLNASCTDPAAKPTITVTPSVIPAFETVEGKQVTGVFIVKSENCTDFVHLRVDHVQGQAFTISESLLAKNYESEVTVFFTPLAAGSYQSTVTITSANADTVVLTLNGTASAKSTENIDWTVDFQWDASAPTALLNERFDSAGHNETLVLEGWQNIAALDARPWWGFDEAATTPKRGTERYAKATAYQYGRDSTGIWEMWLVTPALDYRNAPVQVFAFSVMGEYLPEEAGSTTLEVYFIDASDPQKPFFQAFEGLTIPKTTEESGVWVPFVIHLENQSYIPDAFYMAFRYRGPNGDKGAATYYIDNVSWGVEVAEGINPTPSLPSREGEKILRDGRLLILRNGKTYNVLGGME